MSNNNENKRNNMNKKLTNKEESFGIWKKNAMEKIEAFHPYTDEDKLRRGIIEISSLVSDIQDKKEDLSLLLDMARDREKVLIEKFAYVINGKNTKSDKSENDSDLFCDGLGMP